MQRRLAANIVARDPETGVVRTFLAGETVPAWAAERITNPDVWASDGPDGGAVAERPPVTGRGSGKAAWVAYAQQMGLAVTPGMTREDIMEAFGVDGATHGDEDGDSDGDGDGDESGSDDASDGASDSDDTDSGDDADDDGEVAERPPETGKGSGKAAWVAYAEQVGVEVTEAMTRDDIIDAVDDAED